MRLSGRRSVIDAPCQFVWLAPGNVRLELMHPSPVRPEMLNFM